MVVRAAAGALLVGVLLSPPAAATAAGGSAQVGQDPAVEASVQSMLDTVIGPGHSHVVVVDTIDGSTASITGSRYGRALPAQQQTGRTTATASPGDRGSQVSRRAVDAVGSVSTTTTVPAGRLLRRSTAVVVDRAVVTPARVRVLRRLLIAAVAYARSRGDVVTIAAVPFPAVAASGASVAAGLPAVPVAGAVAAALVGLVLALTIRRRRRRGSPAA